MSKQNSFLQIAMNKKTLKCEKFLNEMAAVLPWAEMLEKISPVYKDKEIGRHKVNLMVMLKIYFLQQWYNLSDPGAEEAIYDRNSFQKFLGIDLLSDTVPDETTILNFRHLLEENQLQKALFETINQILESKGLLMREGTIVDATIIKAPSSKKNQESKRDEDMSFTRKNGQWNFGMKVHTGNDAKSGLVHSVTITTAKVHDRHEREKLLHGKEKSIFGDKAYGDNDFKKQCRQQDIFYGIPDKGSRFVKLSNKQQKMNCKKSRVRSRVEFPYRIVKNLWGHYKTRYRGLYKNGMQMIMLMGLSNIYLVRKDILAQI